MYFHIAKPRVKTFLSNVVNKKVPYPFMIKSLLCAMHRTDYVIDSPSVM